MTTDIIVQLPKQDALQVFVTDGGIDPYIEKIREEALSLVPDISTKKGRAEIASMAAKVARSKTYLEDAGKQLCDQERAKIDLTLSAVMASRKLIKQKLDDLRDEVRKPLTDWENAEAERKGKIESRIEAMKRLPEIGSDLIALQKHLKRLESTEIDESFGEYTADAAIARTHAIRDCNIRINNQIKIEQDLKELEELRIKNAAQEQKDREDEIAKQAAYIATQKAEREAQAKIDEANTIIERERAAKEEKAKADAEENARIADAEYRQRVIEESIQSLVDNGFGNVESGVLIGLILDGVIKNIFIKF